MPQIVELIAGLLNVALNIKKQEITEKPGRDAVKAEQLDYYKDLPFLSITWFNFPGERTLIF